MGQTDWTELTDDLDLASLDRGVTTGMTPPNGGGSFVFGFNSLVTSTGAAGYRTNQSGFNPTAANKGGSIRGAIQRGISSDDTFFAPLLYMNLQGTSVNDYGYILGLQDDEPHRIALRKGLLVEGIPSASPGASGILERSTATFTKGAWLHLRLDVIVNLNGDVLLQCFQNDLTSNAVTSPVWVAIPGLTNVVDDSLGIRTGSAPYTSGYMGFGFRTAAISRRGFFDHIECYRQN